MGDEKGLHIVKLEIKNYGKISAVAMEPSGALVVLGGANDSGKSTVIDCIAETLGGARFARSEPIRRGERRAESRIDIGEYVVEKTWTPKGSALTVRDRDGLPLGSPQKVLDRLFAGVAFDPLAFTRMKPKEQSELLCQISGWDPAQFDLEYQREYQARRDVNRELARLDAALGTDFPSDIMQAPNQEVDLAALIAERDAMVERRQDIAAFQASKAARERELIGLREQIEVLLQREKDVFTRLKEAVAALEQMGDPPDTAKITAQIAAADQTNRRAREKGRYVDLRAQLDEQRAAADGATRRMAQIAEQKRQALLATKFPVPGLSVDDDGVTFGGFALAQTCQSAQLRVSVAIGFAMNPRLKIMLVKDGSLLDAERLALLRDLATAEGGQVFLERVSTGDEVSYVIEDGTVREAVDGK